MKEIRFKLTQEDEIVRKHSVVRGEVVKFSIQYNALIDGRWRGVVRYDNFHGEPHKHTFRYDGSERKSVIFGNNPSILFTKLLNTTKKDSRKIRERYVLTKYK